MNERRTTGQAHWRRRPWRTHWRQSWGSSHQGQCGARTFVCLGPPTTIGRIFTMRRLLRPLIAALAAVAGLFAIMATTGAFGGSDGGVASAASPAQQIGMRVLLITDSNSDSTASGIAYNDWVNTLKREGVPYDTRRDQRRQRGQRPAADAVEHRVRRHPGRQLRGRHRGDVGHGGYEHRPVDDAADLRAAVLGSPAHGLCRAEQRLRSGTPPAPSAASRARLRRS